MTQPAPANAPRAGSDHIIPHLAALVSDTRLGALQPLCVELADLSQMSASEAAMKFGGGVMLLEQGVPGWDELLLKLAVDRPSTAVIVLSDQIPGNMVRALMKLDSSDVLPVSSSPEDIAEAVEKFRDTANGGVGGSSVCWAFRGAVGGAGVTTIAIESAFELARRFGPGRVCLVDLNVADGMTTSFLEAVPKLDLSALSAAPERLDPRLLAAWCYQHESGVSIIAAPRNPDGDVLASEPAILRLLDVACGMFEFTIVDMPRHMMPWTKSVLSAVDEAIVISELTVPSLHAAADMARETDVLRSDRAPAKLVLNRMFQKKRLRAEFALDKAEGAIDRKIDSTITSDWDAARTAVNLGRPIAEVVQKSPLVSDIGKLVQMMLPEEAQAAIPVEGKRRRRG
ncbi:CpaE family protein [Hyphomonas sp.]|uniref:AAA family ATPase n=1 Tax=Hyphomonas sp. TaxID=87 RepID=UPI003529064A